MAAGVAGLPVHSPVGASGAHRWFVCPGSVTESIGFTDEESDHAALGTDAHALGAACLSYGKEPWQHIGWYIRDEVFARVDDLPQGEEENWRLIDKDMADAVQQYVATLEKLHPRSERNQGNTWIELPFHCPTIHEFFYGTADFVFWDQETCVLHVHDYKHGAGIFVEAYKNPQLLYYAAGTLERLNLWDKVDGITLHVHQPRCWAPNDETHRRYGLSVDELVEWLEDECIPAMEKAVTSDELKSGEHCRFCPARFGACRQLMADMVEYEGLMMDVDAKGADELTVEQLGRLLELHELGKIVIKAANKTAHGKLSNGHKVPGVKLVKSRTNRAFKEGAEEAAVKTFGKGKAYHPPKLKSPAEFDKMPEGKAFTARWAFKPEGGTTIALTSDPRRPVKRDAKSLFAPVKKES